MSSSDDRLVQHFEGLVEEAATRLAAEGTNVLVQMFRQGLAAFKERYVSVMYETEETATKGNIEWGDRKVISISRDPVH